MCLFGKNLSNFLLIFFAKSVLKYTCTLKKVGKSEKMWGKLGLKSNT